MGEGWHNNHHFYQSTANQGWFWWEIDGSYYILKMLSWLGLVWDLRTPPKHIKYAHLAPTSAAPSSIPLRALAQRQD
jgi:stearoyl-CoA desaturase (delta-9 desaturase)